MDFPPQTDIYYVQSHSYSLIQRFFASIIQFPKQENFPPYHELICTDEDKELIYEIITLMANNGKVSLLFRRGYIESLGEKIQHVHPLKFLSTIFVHPHLRVSLTEIFDDYFKRNGFMDGLAPRLSREAERGSLNLYIADFANEVNVPKECLIKYFRNHEWEGLSRYFIQ